MSDINTVSLLNQLRGMASEAQGVNNFETIANPVKFGEVFQNALGEVNHLQQATDGLRTQFELGDNRVSLGDVMVAAQKSSLAFEATLRVRNKLVQAYQDIMNMPV